MALAPELVEILACPKCHGHLLYGEAEALLACPACRLGYRIEEDLPILLIDEAASVDEATVARLSGGARSGGGTPAPR